VKLKYTVPRIESLPMFHGETPERFTNKYANDSAVAVASIASWIGLTGAIYAMGV